MQNVLFLATAIAMPLIDVNSCQWTVDVVHNQMHVNGKPIDVDIVHLSENVFHVIYQRRSYRVIVIEYNKENKSLLVDVNGNNYVVSVKNKMDLLLQQMGLTSLTTHKANDLKAPMPGKVLHVHVKKGDQVKKGDSLLILEAMKMENILKSPGEATVKEVKIKQGDAVEKNQLLIVFE